jgi:hypothetical protein
MLLFHDIIPIENNRLPIISNNSPIPCFDSGHLSLANSRSSGKDLEDKLIDLKMRLLVGWYVLSLIDLGQRNQFRLGLSIPSWNLVEPVSKKVLQNIGVPH